MVGMVFNYVIYLHMDGMFEDFLDVGQHRHSISESYELYPHGLWARLYSCYIFVLLMTPLITRSHKGTALC